LVVILISVDSLQIKVLVKLIKNMLMVFNEWINKWGLVEVTLIIESTLGLIIRKMQSLLSLIESLFPLIVSLLSL
jgi:hypothetical protein